METDRSDRVSQKRESLESAIASLERMSVEMEIAIKDYAPDGIIDRIIKVLSPDEKHKLAEKLFSQYRNSDYHSLNHCHLCNDKDINCHGHDSDIYFCVCSKCQSGLCSNCDNSVDKHYRSHNNTPF